MRRHLSLWRFLLPLVALLLATLPASADIFEVDSLWYETLASDPSSVALTISRSETPYHGRVVIPATVTHQGKTYTVREIGSNSLCDFGITAIIMPNTITKLRKHAIQGYVASLTELVLSQSLEVLDTMSLNVPVITQLTLPASLKKIGYKAINAPITSITIPAGVEVIEAAPFNGCDKLVDILVDADNKHYANINDYLCTKDGKTLIQSAPAVLRTELELPTSVETIMDWAFQDNEGLTSLIIPDHVKSIGFWAFGGTNHVKEIHIGKGVTKIEGYAFALNTRATKLTLGENVDSICEHAFEWLGGQVDMSHPLRITPKLKYIGPDAFTGSSFDEIIVEEGVEQIDSMALRDIPFTKLTLPSTLKRIGYRSFGECSLVRKIKLPDNLEYIGDGAFAGCWQVSVISIPAATTHIGKRAFQSAINLMGFMVAADNPAYMSDNGILFSKDKSTLVAFPAGRPDTLYNVPESVTTLLGGCFAGNEKIKEINFNNNNMNWGEGVMQSCLALKRVKLPTNLKEIPQITFYGCNALDSICIPGTVESIGMRAFTTTEKSSGLNRVVIPRSVREIDNWAFNQGNAPNLGWVYVDNSVPPTLLLSGQKEIYCFSGRTTFYGTLFVPPGAVDTYRNAPGWNSFKNIVEDPSLGVADIEMDETSVNTSFGNLNVNAPEGTPVEVWNMSGLRVWQGTAPAAISSLQKGIYIVRVGGTTVKAAI